MQDGRYVNKWAEYPHAVNVSSSGSGSDPDDPNGFTAFSHTDLQNSTDLFAPGGKCTQSGTPHEQLVKACVNDPPTGQCCLDLSDAQLDSQVGFTLHNPKVYTFHFMPKVYTFHFTFSLF